MSCPIKENLTPENYQEIKNKLEKENLESFPSVFQQARNLAKQAWLSGVDVAKGKPLLSTAEKANERIKICNGCEFFKEDRCLKCGCFMNAKIHLESSRCPINKWGPELQAMNSAEQVNAAMTRAAQPAQNVKQTETELRLKEIKQKETNLINLLEQSEKIPVEVESTIKNIVERMGKMSDSSSFEARFLYEGNDYMIKKIAPDHGSYLEQYAPIVISADKNDVSTFSDLVKKHSNISESKTFDFDNEQYFVDIISNKNEPIVYKIDKQIMQRAFSKVNILDKK
jgi:hypothetical protein